ncbi:hypothetical protein TNCV_1213051 [Trichonephila clavipes]|nr:hypothetical protein TNCV_1213051 [Trichonephila clavipes]
MAGFEEENERDGLRTRGHLFGQRGGQSDNLATGREVVLQWIPSHCGIHGNEQADKLARGFDAASNLRSDASLRNAKRLLRDKFRQKRISTLTELAVGKS